MGVEPTKSRQRRRIGLTDYCGKSSERNTPPSRGSREIVSRLLLALAGSLRSLLRFFGLVWLVFDCEFASVGVCFDHAPRNMDESETCEGHSCSLVEICEGNILGRRFEATVI